MSSLAEITKAGLFTTVQDMGRPGARHFGVPLSGAADPLSLSLANTALGNDPYAAGLECTMTGPRLRFLKDGAIAIGGANMYPLLNNAPCPLYTQICVASGDELSLGAATKGARAYIAFAGGVSGSSFLNSVSTHTPAELGGHEGRALKRGDLLISASLSIGSPRDIPQEMQPRFAHEFILRATPGPEAQSIGAHEVEKFFSAGWTVSRRIDRMGAMLGGTRLDLPPAKPMASSPVFPGTVQCPPDGNPFLLLCDAQTVGGYPRIAQVIAADMPIAGQARPGDQVWFRKTAPEDAQDIARKKSALFGDFFPGGFIR